LLSSRQAAGRRDEAGHKGAAEAQAAASARSSGSLDPKRRARDGSLRFAVHERHDGSPRPLTRPTPFPRGLKEPASRVLKKPAFLFAPLAKGDSAPQARGLSPAEALPCEEQRAKASAREGGSIAGALILGAALALAAAPAPAAAQEVPAGEGEEEAVRLPKMTIEAQGEGYRAERLSSPKFPAPLKDTPQSATIVTREAIEDLDLSSMADVVRYVPGVQMGQGEGHRDAPTLRGNASTADFFVDGVRDDVQYYRDLYNAERIEVLKGPNAMLFGRGEGGGIINRVTKSADGVKRAEAAFATGSYGHYRGEIDAGAAVSEALALRLNGMYEDSDSFRSFFNLRRFGINPTLAYKPGARTEIRLSYEYFDDERTVDRGIPSRNGRPFDTAAKTFFGNPDISYTTAQVHLAALTLSHRFTDALRLRNHTLFAAYDKFYQNVFARNAVTEQTGAPLGPCAVGDLCLNLEAYHSATERKNVFNQTDLTWESATGPVGHALAVGLEIGRQWTDNVRDNSSFNPRVLAASPLSFAFVPFDIPNQNNHVDVTVFAAYAQDHITLFKWLELLGGVRYDRIEIDFDNVLVGSLFSRTDDLVSPRGGVIVKPHESVSIYGSYSVSYLPQSGDQFASLNATTAALRPERFENLEAGVKWEISPALALSAAVYRLDRENTTAPGPAAGTIVLTGSQRAEGVEIEVQGRITEDWQVIGGYAYQKATITSTTSAAPAGRSVPLVPRHSASLWNKVQLTPHFGAGLGVITQSEVFTSISNAVTLPALTRVDAALFFRLNEHLEAQVNVENLFDRRYYATAHNDNNITPGSPIAVRLGLRARL
jgi:catecholate siderophore receptor